MLYWLFLLSLLIPSYLCHVKLLWPPPRTDQYGPRDGGPCGGDSWDDGVRANRITQWRAGATVKITITEAAHHARQPYRIALSRSNKDEGFDSCILLNHIPQHTRDGAKNIEIDLTLPDFTCRNCTLQLINFQTSGLGDNNCCVYNNNDKKDCPEQQYWSCANVDITGGDSDERECYQPNGWAFRDLTCNYYSSESSAAAYQTVNGTTLKLLTNDASLEGIPENFCGDTDATISRSSSCAATYSGENLSFINGGELQTDGAVAIVIVLVLGIAIAATYYFAKKKNAGNALGDRSTAEIDQF